MPAFEKNLDKTYNVKFLEEVIKTLKVDHDPIIAAKKIVGESASKVKKYFDTGNNKPGQQNDSDSADSEGSDSDDEISDNSEASESIS